MIAFNIWSKYINPERIMGFGDMDNFGLWEIHGACGPSEIFYDQGEEHFNTPEDKWWRWR